MLLDRRTGGALQHLRALWTSPLNGQQRRPAVTQSEPLGQLDA